MSSLDISDDEFNIDDSEFAVIKPTSEAPPPPAQSASQRILAQRQQQHEQQEQSQRMQAYYQSQSQPPVQPPSNYQQKIQQYQEQQEQAQYASQQMQAQLQSQEPQQQQHDEQPAGWQPTRVDSKFDQKELNSIKGAAKQTVMGGHKTQENNRISMGGVDQTESTRLAPETLKAIRALKQGPAPEPPPKPDTGFMGKIKKLFGGKE